MKKKLKMMMLNNKKIKSENNKKMIQILNINITYYLNNFDSNKRNENQYFQKIKNEFKIFE